MRTVHTLAILEVAPETYQDIKQRIEALDRTLRGQYEHMLLRDGNIDMHGIAISAEADKPGMTLAVKVAAWDAVEHLRKNEGDDVRILCDNPDGLCAIVCNGEWTGYDDLRVEGENVHNALITATGLYDDFYSSKTEEQVTHYGVFRKQVPNSPMIKEANFFKEQGGLTQEWGKHWEPIHGCKTIGEARRKIAAKYGAELSPIYSGEL